MDIPKLKSKKIVVIQDQSEIDLFYGFNSIEEKSKSIDLMKKKSEYFIFSMKRVNSSEILNDTLRYSLFKVFYDFKNNTTRNNMTWSSDGIVMIYENHNVDDETRILANGKGNYECILWVHAQKATSTTIDNYKKERMIRLTKKIAGTIILVILSIFAAIGLIISLAILL